MSDRVGLQKPQHAIAQYVRNHPKEIEAFEDAVRVRMIYGTCDMTDYWDAVEAAILEWRSTRVSER